MPVTSHTHTHSRSLRFDMMTLMRTPTCVNYHMVMNAILHLTPKGLRRAWVVAPKQWLEDIGRWHHGVWAVDEDAAVLQVGMLPCPWKEQQPE